jgi:hypothetical protein
VWHLSQSVIVSPFFFVRLLFSVCQESMVAFVLNVFLHLGAEIHIPRPFRYSSLLVAIVLPLIPQKNNMKSFAKANDDTLVPLHF